MGRKGGWFSALKKALTPESKKKDKAANKSKWFGKEKSGDLGSSKPETTTVINHGPIMPQTEQTKLMEAENEQNKHAYSVAIATAVAAEAAVAAAQAAAEVVRLTAAARNLGKSKEEIAAIKIQTAFRGYMARRALRALKGLVRLKSMLSGKSVQRQAASTLKCMQTLARVQSEVRARRIRMLEDNQSLQRQIQQKHDKELEKLRLSYDENWDDSTQSKEQIEASLQHKHEAAKRRERALAYAYTHQTLRNTPKATNQTFMNPSDPHWGWSWLERWMSARPWESNKNTAANEPSNDTTTRPSPTPHRQPRTPNFHSPSTPTSKPRRFRPQSPRGSYAGDNNNDDLRSLGSVQSERCRRHSIAGSSVRDDDSLASSPAIPGYMTPTESARARSRLPSPLSSEKNYSGSAKKRLSFSGSPGGARRHSGPPKIDVAFSKYLNANA